MSRAISRTTSLGVKCSPASLVVLLVEAPDELFEDRAHSVVVETLQTHGVVSIQGWAWG